MRVPYAATSMRILLVSQMYPSARAPDLGTFVADLEGALADRGHEIARAVVDHRGGKTRHLALARDVLLTSRRFRPDVVYAHFLAPAGFLAAVETRAPLVVTAHGQDVENACVNAGVRAASRIVVEARRLGRRRLGVAAATARAGSAGCARQDARDRLRRRYRPLRAAPTRRRTGARRLVADRHRLPRRRLADCTEERAPPRPRVRAPGGGITRLRRRRPAAWSARGPRGDPTSPARSRTTVSRTGSRRPTSSANRAWSSRSAWPPSRRWRPGVRSSRPGSEDRPSSSTPAAGVIVDPEDDDGSGLGTRRGGSAAAAQ